MVPSPVQGGVLTVGTNIPTAETVDPATATTQWIVPNICDPPLRADPLFNLSPAGCSDWSPNKNASVWTISRCSAESSSRTASR